MGRQGVCRLPRFLKGRYRSAMLKVSGLSDRGRLRPANEDSLVVRPEQRLFAVADGMGGHAAGEVASRLAAGVIEQLELPVDPSLDGLPEVIAQGIRAANHAIVEDSSVNRDHMGMGTTLTVLALAPDLQRAVYGHVGDSRLYQLRGRKLEQITRDHTWVQEQVDAGRLSIPQARSHPLSSVLTRALGTEPNVDVDTGTLDCLPGDRFLLCSDGLTGMLVDRIIADIMIQDAGPREIAEQLIEAANDRGGADNITVVVVALE
jgi:serine/threonine protein phosphatase PrpC